jgi:hypothetical protein
MTLRFTVHPTSFKFYARTISPMEKRKTEIKKIEIGEIIQQKISQWVLVIYARFGLVIKKK